MVLFRSAVKQICRRHGYHATFMCRPRLPNVMSSAAGTCTSRCVDAQDRRATPSRRGGRRAASPTVGRIYLAGLLEHARAAGGVHHADHQRLQALPPYSLAPDRAIWGRDNRGAMVRVLGGARRSGDAAREPRRRAGGQPLPLHGVADHLPASTASSARARPRPVRRHALRDARPSRCRRAWRRRSTRCASDAFFREELGSQFVDYHATIKDAEIARFQAEVTDWEHREYFEMF